MEKAPAGITGSFNVLFLMVLGRFPERFSFVHIFPLQHDYRSNTIRLSYLFNLRPKICKSLCSSTHFILNSCDLIG